MYHRIVSMPTYASRMSLTSLESAGAEVARLSDELSVVRSKLHNAVRKGKTIDAERVKKAAEAEQLAAKVAHLKHELQEANLKQGRDALLDTHVNTSQHDFEDLLKHKHLLEQRLESQGAQLQDSAFKAASLEERLQQVQAEANASLEAVMSQLEASKEEALRQAAAREALLQCSLSALQQERAEQQCVVRPHHPPYAGFANFLPLYGCGCVLVSLM